MQELLVGMVQLNDQYFNKAFKNLILIQVDHLGRFIKQINIVLKPETELCLSISCGVTGQQWTAAETGALGAAVLGMA